MGFSISIDWYDELRNNPEKWTNKGRNVLFDSCKHNAWDEGYCEKCDIYEDSCEPMMNFGYPLELEPDKEKVLKVAKQTNCTIMENQNTGENFLVLCGGGMDLSQDIAYSYLILERWIPEDLIGQVSKQEGLSISKEKFKILKKAIIEQLQIYENKFKNYKEEWKALK